MSASITFDETLKSIRFTSRVLLGAAGTILLFCLSPNTDSMYDDAVKDLTRLREFLGNRMPNYTFRRPDRPAEELLKGAMRVNAVLDSIDLQGWPLMNGVPVVLDLTPFQFIDSAHRDTDVFDLYMAFQSINEMQAYIFDIADANKTIAKAIEENAYEPTSPYESDQERQELIEIGQIWRSVELVCAGGQLHVELVGGDQDADSLQIARISGEPSSRLRMDLQKWKVVDERGVLLPGLGPWIVDLKGASIDQGIAHLTAEKFRNHGKITVFAVEINSALVATAGPLIMLLVAAYLLAYLRNLRLMIAPARSNHECVVDSGLWIGASLDSVGGCAAYSAIVVPSIASAFVVWTLTGRDQQAWVGVCTTVALAIIAGFSLVETHRFRRMLQPTKL